MLAKSHPLVRRLRGDYAMKPLSSRPALMGVVVALPVVAIGVLAVAIGGAWLALLVLMTLALPVLLAADAAWVVVNDVSRPDYLLLTLPFDGLTMARSYLTALFYRWTIGLLLLGMVLMPSVFAIGSLAQRDRLREHGLVSPNEAIQRCTLDANYNFFDTRTCYDDHGVVHSMGDLPIKGFSAVVYYSELEAHASMLEVLFIVVCVLTGFVGLGFAGLGLGLALGMWWRSHSAVMAAVSMLIVLGAGYGYAIMLWPPVPDGHHDLLIVPVWLVLAALPYALTAGLTLLASWRAATIS